MGFDVTVETGPTNPLPINKWNFKKNTVPPNGETAFIIKLKSQARFPSQALP